MIKELPGAVLLSTRNKLDSPARSCFLSGGVMNDLTSFFSALLNHWVVLMSGVVSLAITLILRIRGKDISNKVFWSIAVVFLFVACFLAWRDEHIAKAPNLACQIEKVVIGKGPDTDLTQVLVLLSVKDV